MDIILKGLIMEYDGSTLVWRNDIHVPAHPCMYTKKYIVNKILEAQRTGTIDKEYISPEEWDKHFADHENEYGLIPMETLTFYNDELAICMGSNSYMVDLIEIRVKPVSNEEINIYFEQYIQKQYNVLPKDVDSFNSLLVLPNLYIFRGYGITESGDYITADAFTEYKRYLPSGISDKDIEYSYVIHKSALQYPILNINAPKSLIPHLVGKGGKRITAFKNLLKEYTSEVRRINLVPFDTNDV